MQSANRAALVRTSMVICICLGLVAVIAPAPAAAQQKTETGGDKSIRDLTPKFSADEIAQARIYIDTRLAAKPRKVLDAIAGKQGIAADEMYLILQWLTRKKTKSFDSDTPNVPEGND